MFVSAAARLLNWIPLRIERNLLLCCINQVDAERIAHEHTKQEAVRNFFFDLGPSRGVTRDRPRLVGKHCAFGYAVSGNRAIDSIAATPLDDVGEGRPRAIPRIVSMQLIAAPPRMPGIDRRESRVKATIPAGESPPTTR